MEDLAAIGLYPLRGLAGCCHLLVDGEEAILLDTGFVGERRELERLLHRLGLGFPALRAIVLTHGHLDHAGNLARVAALSGAPVYGHPAEQAHLDGAYPYRGWARGCGWLEAAGRPLIGYRPGRITRFLADGEELPFWGGLRVVHLPGHTAGHCGFYSARHDLLFSGDLFASYWFAVHRPPCFLNSVPHLYPASLARVRALNPARIMPNHYDRPDPRLHAARFARLTAGLPYD
jgi:glyoxylase-like metal-dependent hydrolase (beta-lactamase superfamily II)